MFFTIKIMKCFMIIKVYILNIILFKMHSLKGSVKFFVINNSSHSKRVEN